MFARNVAFSLKPGSAPEFSQKFESEVLPLLQKQDGFREEFVLLGDDNVHGHAISLWESREHADAYDKKAYALVLQALEKVVVGVPKVRTSTVVHSSTKLPAATAAVV